MVPGVLSWALAIKILTISDAVAEAICNGRASTATLPASQSKPIVQRMWNVGESLSFAQESGPPVRDPDLPMHRLPCKFFR